MLTHDENQLLCRVEGNAPMGQHMRRHWLPACLIEEVGEADGTPVREKMLGEDLVAFRDKPTAGWASSANTARTGAHRCARPQRGVRAALPLSRLEDGRRRQCRRDAVRASRIATGGEGEARRLPDARGRRLRVGVHGSAGTMPEFEAPAFAPTPETNVAIVKVVVPCNWAQILEGAIDSAHSSSPALDRYPAGPRRP